MDSAEEESSESDPEPDEAVTGYLGGAQEGGAGADFFREEGWSELEEVGRYDDTLLLCELGAASAWQQVSSRQPCRGPWHCKPWPSVSR